MIFLANIGNTNVTYGLFREEIIVSGHFPITTLQNPQDIGALCSPLLEECGVSWSGIEGAVVSSVVPEKNVLLLEGLKHYISSEPLFISKRTDWSFDHSAYSGVLGTDRLLCCFSALKKYRPPFIVIDCGTATTVNIMDQDGAFQGGVILPGVSMGLRALAEHTSQLPSVAFFHPKSVIGKNTEECIWSGALYGTASLLEGLVWRIRRELSADVPVIITGGNAKTIVPYCELKLHIEPNLLLEGLAHKFIEDKVDCSSRVSAL